MLNGVLLVLRSNDDGRSKNYSKLPIFNAREEGLKNIYQTKNSMLQKRGLTTYDIRLSTEI